MELLHQGEICAIYEEMRPALPNVETSIVWGFELHIERT